MKLTLIEVPYHYGFVQPRYGAGRGPGRYREAGLTTALAGAGFEVAAESIERPSATEEIPAAVAEGNRLLAAQVSRALASGAFPLVLSGGCNACLGILAGLNSRVGVVWFDAHGDFNTPETTPSGFFDGMPLAIAAGLGHHDLRSKITDSPPVPGPQILLVGARDLDPGERVNIQKAGVGLVTAADIKSRGVVAALAPKLRSLREQVADLYLHFDIDVLDPALAPGVDYRAPGGLSLEEAEDAIRLLAAQFHIRAAALTAYNPDREEEGRTLAAGLRVLSSIAAAVRGTGR